MLQAQPKSLSQGNGWNMIEEDTESLSLASAGTHELTPTYPFPHIHAHVQASTHVQTHNRTHTLMHKKIGGSGEARQTVVAKPRCLWSLTDLTQSLLFPL